MCSIFYLYVSASLSKPTTEVPSRNSYQEDSVIPRLRGLLVPKQPGIQRGTTTAYSLTRFTEVLNSFAANAGTTGGTGCGGGDGQDRSRVALASVFGTCRLCLPGGRYIHALGMQSTNLSVQFTKFVICKLLE